MSTGSIQENLDATISSAVKAQVQAKVLEALSGNDFFATYIVSVLQRKVEIPDPAGGYNRKIQIDYIDSLLRHVIEDAVKLAVCDAVNDQRDLIQDAVRRSVKRRAEQFAENITDSLVEHVGKDHGVKFDIALTLPRRGIDY